MTAQVPKEAQPVPEVDILFLGSPGVGKATFLSFCFGQTVLFASPSFPPSLQSLTTGTHPRRQAQPARATAQASLRPGRAGDLRRHPVSAAVPVPYPPVDIAAVHRPVPPNPAFAIIAFSISSRDSLYNAQHYWRHQLSLHYHDLEHTMPVMLLGLKRDERTEERREDGSYECVMPQEALRVAQEMYCDRYAECSAVTGELMFEVLEDITRTAAKTTTKEGGGLSGTNACSVM
ncbi:hypothetical protein FOPE_01225 [Fonsecaea pedrosoi]|nr:hypothetical protein FOPE_01225 [Fonsecaea pedrosoi]